MSQIKPAANTATHEHVHGPDCQHDGQHNHDHGHDHDAAPQEPFRREAPKLGRNDACHCGSGKKFKKCHGAQS